MLKFFFSKLKKLVYKIRKDPRLSHPLSPRTRGHAKMKRMISVAPEVKPHYDDLDDWDADVWLDVEAKKYLFPKVAEEARKVKHNIMEIVTDAGSRDFLILEVDMPYPSMRLEQERYLGGEESRNCLIVVEIAEHQQLLAMTCEDVHAVLNGTGDGAGAIINILPRKSVRVLAKYGDVIPLLDQFDNKTIWDWHTSDKKIVWFNDRLCGQGPFQDPAACLLRCTDSKEMNDPVTRIKVAEQKVVMAMKGYFEALWLWPNGSRVDDMDMQCHLTSVAELVRQANDAKTHAFQQQFMQHVVREATDVAIKQKDRDELEEVCHKIDQDRRNMFGHLALQMDFVEKHAPVYFDYGDRFTDQIKFVRPLTDAAQDKEPKDSKEPEPFSPQDEVEKPVKKPRT